MDLPQKAVQLPVSPALPEESLPVDLSASAKILPYRSQVPIQRTLIPVRLLINSVITTSLLTILLAVVTPHFKGMLHGLHVALTPITQTLLNCSDFFCEFGWIWVWLITLAAPFVIHYLRAPRPQPSRAKIVGSALLTFVTAAIVLFLIGFFAFMLPLITLITSLTGGGR